MDKEKKIKYSKALLSAYQNGVLKIVWSTSGFSIAIDSKRKGTIPEIKEEEFIEYAFSVIKIIIDLAEEKEIDENYKNDLEIAKKIFDKEHDLKNHLYIKKKSKIDCFKLLEYEIISHRSEDNPINIEATSAIVKMVIEKGDDESTYTFETSIRDLEDIIAKLVEIKEKIEMIR